MKNIRLVLNKATLFSLLVAAALAGFCGGFLANGAVIRARVRRISTVSDDMPSFLTGKLTDLLGLDASQQDAIHGIFERHDARMKEERERGRATVDAMVADLDSEIGAVLTPEQRKVHEEHLDRMRQRARENRQLRRAVENKR